MAQIAGVWKLTHSENFDELMKELGVGLITRKLGNTTKPTVTIKANGDQYEMLTESALKSNKWNFKIGQEDDQETLDGRKVKAKFAINGNKLVQTERDKDGRVTCVIERSVNEKGELVAIAKAGDVVSTRVYTKQA